MCSSLGLRRPAVAAEGDGLIQSTIEFQVISIPMDDGELWRLWQNAAPRLKIGVAVTGKGATANVRWLAINNPVAHHNAA